jgi:hypothetical protein
MGEISYSSEALNTLPKFHRTKYVIYVEGDDDIPFWQVVFQAFGLKDFVIKPAGGVNEIEKYTRSILDENVGIYVARDSDFKELLNQQGSHPRILWTYGHSIENTLYHPIQIAEIISVYSRSQGFNALQVEAWLQNFSNEFWALLVYEISNEKYQKGIEVLGKKCNKFLPSKKAHLPSIALITQKLDIVCKEIDSNEYIEAEKILVNATKRKPIFFLIRGHFLTNAVINYIKSKVRKINKNKKDLSLSEDSLFAHLITALKSECVSNSSREDLKYLKLQILSWI